MSSIPTSHALFFAVALFIVGIVGLIARRNLVFVLMSVEIMLNAATIAFVAGGAKWNQPDGQVVVIFILVTAAAEVAVGLALLIRIYQNVKSVDSNEVSEMKG